MVKSEEIHVFDPFSGPFGSRVKRFLESEPPWWWDRFMPWLLIAGLCWYFGPLAVATFIVTVLVNILVVAFPVYFFVFLVTGGR